MTLPDNARCARVILAQLRSHFYLLFYGMWRGQCEFRGEDDSDRMMLIFAGTGTMTKGNIRVKKIFLNVRQISAKDIEEIYNSHRRVM